jgi:hypothetical protein
MFKFTGDTPAFNEHIFSYEGSGQRFKLYRNGRLNKLAIVYVRPGSWSWLSHILHPFEINRVYRLGLIYNPFLPGNNIFSAWIDGVQVQMMTVPSRFVLQYLFTATCLY